MIKGIDKNAHFLCIWIEQFVDSSNNQDWLMIMHSNHETRLVKQQAVLHLVYEIYRRCCERNKKIESRKQLIEIHKILSF